MKKTKNNSILRTLAVNFGEKDKKLLDDIEKYKEAQERSFNYICKKALKEFLDKNVTNNK